MKIPAIPPAARRTYSHRNGFEFRFLLLSAVLVAVPAGVAAIGAAGQLGYLQGVALAAVIVFGYLWRPRESLLAFALFILFYDTLARWLGTGIRNVDEIAVPIIFLVAGASVVPRWRSWFRPLREGSIAIAMALGIASSVAASVPVDIWVPSMGLVAKGIAFFYVVMWTPFSLEDVRSAARIVVVVGAVVLLLAFVEMIDPLRFQRTLGLTEYYRPRGTLPAVKSLFFHPVLFAWFTTFVALFAYAHHAVTRRWWSFVVATALSLGPFLAARRRAILALVGGVLAGFARSVGRSRTAFGAVRIWLPAIISLTVIAVAFLPGLVGLYNLTLARYIPQTPTPVPSFASPSSSPSSPTPAPGTESGNENLQARVALYVGSFKVARDYFPLGAGFGRYGSYMSGVEYSPVYSRYGLDRVNGLRPHNPRNVTDTFWPQILGELGVFGAIAYGGFMASLGWLLWAEAGRRGPPVLRYLRLGAGMVFAQALIESLASPMFHSPPRVYLLYLTVGAVAAAAWQLASSEETAEVLAADDPIQV